jgi:hypothetical protein
MTVTEYVDFLKEVRVVLRDLDEAVIDLQEHLLMYYQDRGDEDAASLFYSDEDPTLKALGRASLRQLNKLDELVEYAG